MDAVLDALGVLHLLRPMWLLGLPLIALVWWVARRPINRQATTPAGIAPHLSKALTVGNDSNRRWQPADGVAIILGLLVMAAAGPTWSRVANPFLSQTAPMVVVLEVTRSMEAPDLQPSRLERAKFKIRDLLERRAGARTALIAFAGSAHRVAPLTEDPEILRAMLTGLVPDVMPIDGTNATSALELARLELEGTQTPGAILLVGDGLDNTDIAALDGGEGAAPVIVLFAAPESEPLGPLDANGTHEVVRLTADDKDLDQIERHVAATYRAALLGDERLDWEDRGWVVAWPAAILLLLWFRQGWTMRWAVVLLTLGFGTVSGGQARAGVVDWFFTPDQQAMMSYNGKAFATAAGLFHDPMWRGHALMKTGKYADAADIFSRMDTAEAAFAEGYSHIRNREYRPAIAAYERALDLRPDFPEARRNLEVSRAILEYVETTREQSDTGEDSGLGADDVVYDNEAGRGADTQTDFSDKENAREFATTEQWMRSVDTEMGDFLKLRFRLEAAGGEQ